MRDQPRYLRFGLVYRIEHWVLTASFGLLALTGLIQQHVDAAVPRWIVGALGGIETVRFLHHAAAIVMMLETIYHLGHVAYRIFVLRVPPTMLPGKRDAINIVQSLKYNLGLSKERAKQGFYTFEEKMEYWAVVWGTVVMGLTGFMLWNPIATTRILPGDIVPAAKAAHGLEALLAVLAIVIWHLYHVHIRHLNLSMFHGHMTEEEMEDEHAGTLAAIKSGKRYPPPERPILVRRQRVFFPVFAVLAVVMLAGVWFFIGYEETAIATLPAAETVAVFSPLTPTPLPTARPTNTPMPTATPGAEPVAQPTAQPAAGAAIAWKGTIDALVQAKCVACHNANNMLGGLDLSTYQAALAGGISGAAVVPGESRTSLLYTRQASGGHPGQFTAEEMATVKQWLEAGALEKAAAAPPAQTGGLTWTADIAPLMQNKCAACHSAANPLGGLDVSSYAAAVKGGANGAGIVPGDPQASVLVARQQPGGHPGQLTVEELQQLIDWITAGAPE